MAAPFPSFLPNTTAPLSLSGLALFLMQSGKLTAQQAQHLQQQARLQNQLFIDALLQSGLMEASGLSQFCCEKFAYPFVDLSAVNSTDLPSHLIDAQLGQSQRILALARHGNKLTVAISDPTNTQALDQIKFQTQLLIEPVIVEHPALLQLLKKIYPDAQTLQGLPLKNQKPQASGFFDHANPQPANGLASLFPDSFSDLPAGVFSDSFSSQNNENDDTPVVTFLHKILNEAIVQRASDIHFEPFEKFCRIRFRIDGVLQERTQPPLAMKEKLASRIKVLSRLDIAEKRVPQDGRMKLILSPSRSIDFRVSTLPTVFGEKIVIRILDPEQAQRGIEELGYEPGQRALLLQAIQRPYGMVLVTGPTGSGKTMSLYACLNILNQPGRNISTAEDPAEIYVAGINQVNINERAGLTFPVVLRAFLRQDPDVLMVGEIRDLDTADIAVKAAQTGHMVFSTLHTNDAPSTLTRLISMGVAPFNLAASIVLITAQRLLRRLCRCKQLLTLDRATLQAAGFCSAAKPEEKIKAEVEKEAEAGWQAYQAVGCEHCNYSGYKGRIGIHQVMPVSEKIRQLILTQTSTADIAQTARQEGVLSLREAGLLKVKQGLTSLEEVLACTNQVD